jgi:hypothetical protein
VIDTAGRRLAFGYAGTRLQTITDWGPHGTLNYTRTLPVARAARTFGVFGVGFSSVLLMQSIDARDEYAIASNTIGLGLTSATVAYPILLPADAVFFAVDSTVGVDRMLRLEAEHRHAVSTLIVEGPSMVDPIIELFD